MVDIFVGSYTIQAWNQQKEVIVFGFILDVFQDWIAEIEHFVSSLVDKLVMKVLNVDSQAEVFPRLIDLAERYIFVA